MKYLTLLMMTLFVVACGPTQQNVKNTFKPVTEEDLIQVEIESNIGYTLYQKDSLAWYASDYLSEQGLLDDNKNNLTGWIVNTERTLPSVIFMSYENNAPKAEIEVIPSVDGTIHLFPDSTSDRDASMFKARQTAIQNTERMCKGKYNTVVIDNNDTWLVYLLVSPKQENVLYAGGNYKVTISKEDNTIIESQALSKTCFAMPYKNDGKSWPFFTHIIEPVPNAVHSFLSLQNGIEFFVTTEKGVWKIDEGTIEHLNN